MKTTLKTIFASIFAASLFMSSASFAVEVPGKVYYKMPAGDLVQRAVSLDVPARGQGKVILKSAHHTLESHAFKTKKANGRTIFSVLFLNPPGAPANTAMVLTGTYLRGSNYVAYYGDIYSKPFTEETQQTQVQGERLLDEVLNLHDVAQAQEGEESWRFSGGFKFGMELSKHPHHDQDQDQHQ